MCQRFDFPVKVPSTFTVSLKVVWYSVADINLLLIQSTQTVIYAALRPAECDPRWLEKSDKKRKATGAQ